MSTPSTAAVLPPPYPHYSSHRNHLLGPHPHLTNGHTYPASSSSGTITNGVHPHQVPLPQSTMGSRQVPSQQSNGGRPRKPPVDWNEFYKNGVPREIIVIDDTESPPPSSAAKRTTVTTSRIAPSSNSSTNNIPRHADKRRRTTNGNTYEMYSGPVYSATHTPFTVGHGSPTVTASSSTAGRNSSTLLSTAATSAGSSSYNGSSTVTYPPANGTKRKRTTRATVAAAVAAASGDVYGGYHPPPKPPFKAKEVFVKTIPDVFTPIHGENMKLILTTTCDIERPPEEYEGR